MSIYRREFDLKFAYPPEIRNLHSSSSHFYQTLDEVAKWKGAIKHPSTCLVNPSPTPLLGYLMIASELLSSSICELE